MLKKDPPKAGQKMRVNAFGKRDFPDQHGMQYRKATAKMNKLIYAQLFLVSNLFHG